MKKGFTLIELLVVISIIGILLALSVFGLQGARQSARDARRKSDLEEIRSGLEIYKADCDSYPAALSSQLVGTVDDPSSACSTKNTYISHVPTDPVTSDSYPYYPVLASDGVTYNKYTLCATLEQPPASPIPTGDCGSCSTCNYEVINP
ncbi:MAG: type II secretion system protein [Candidatus Microgenomates bacterium]